MAIEDLKITDAEFLSRSVKGLANRPVSSVGGYGRQDLSSAQLKERFDANGALLKERLNALIDALGSVSGAENIGISSRFTLNGDSVDTVAKFVAFLESDEAVEQIIYNGTQSLYATINGIKATLTEHGLNITALNNFATNAIAKVSVSANESNKTITVSLLDSEDNIKSSATVNVPIPIVDTSAFATDLDGQLTDDGTLKSLLLRLLGSGDAQLATLNIALPIPSEADEDNPLATRGFVNSSVQTATANFRGNWSNFSSVPSDSSGYPADYAGSKVPTVNDYMVVQDASDFPVPEGEDDLVGTWRFKYSGVWATYGKGGWIPEYQVNETPFTDAQLNAINSGITAQIVGSIAGKLDKITSTGTIRAYVTLADGSQATITISKHADANTIARRGENGEIETATATADNHAVNKAQMDSALGGKSAVKVNGSVVGQWDADTKLDKLEASAFYKAYVVNTTGGQEGMRIEASAVQNSLAFRHANGKLFVGTATDNNDAVNLGQMNAAISSHDIEVIFG